MWKWLIGLALAAVLLARVGKWRFLILAIVCLAYGISIVAVRSGSFFWLVWIALGAGFLGIFALVSCGAGDRLPPAVRNGFRFLICAGALWILFCLILILPHCRDQGTPGCDYILVLGAQVWPSGPSLTLQYRLDTAAEYLEKNPETVCIVSGGQGFNEPFPEAEGMAQYLLKKGIPEDRILKESASRNTVENIRFCMELADLAQAGHVGIVTNDFHICRSVGIARKQGLSQAVGIAAPSRVFFFPNNVFRECFGLAKDLLRGNMEIWIH